MEGQRRSARPQQRGELRRQAILRALEEQLAESALADISIEQITQRAGVSRSAFYFYFSTKNVAVAGLLVDRFTRLRDWAWPLLTSQEPTTDRWRKLLTWIVEEWSTQPQMFLAVIDARNADPAARALWEDWISLFVDDLVTFIDHERTRGRAPAGPAARSLASTLTALNQQALENHLRSSPAPGAAHELIGVLTHIWVSSIYGTPQEES